jgi:hypothetical protein
MRYATAIKWDRRWLRVADIGTGRLLTAKGSLSVFTFFPCETCSRVSTPRTVERKGAALLAEPAEALL